MPARHGAERAPCHSSVWLALRLKKEQVPQLGKRSQTGTSSPTCSDRALNLFGDQLTAAPAPRRDDFRAQLRDGRPESLDHLPGILLAPRRQAGLQVGGGHGVQA
jgi:hypothetical protein